MAKYWSASSASIWDSAICDVSAMPSDKVAITDSEYSGLMAKQAQGYKIVNNTSTGKPQAIAQGLTNATRTVQALDSEVVHKTGAETVAGVKTFTDSPKVERVNPYVDIVQTDIKKGTAPSATSYAGVRFGGSEGAADDDKQMGALLHNYYSNGANIMRLQVSKPAAGSTETASLTVAYSGAGDAYASAPTPVNEDDNSTKVATTEWVKKKADKYLPLAGGTMSGGITFNSADVGAVYSDGKDLCLGRATSGSILRLRGQDTNDNAGGFHLRAMDAQGNNWYLIGYADGRLTWGSHDVITAYGGTMEGAINFKNNTEQKIFVDSGGDLLLGDSDVGALLRLRGNASDSNPGGFQFRAQDSSASKYLIGKPDGTLTWNGKDVITSEGGQIDGTFRANTEGFVTGVADDDAVRVSGGTGWDNGGSIVVYGKSHASYAGMFRVKAEDGTNEAILLGKPDGTLQWGGKNVVRSVNGTTADASGNVTISLPTPKAYVTATWKSGNNWYRKWSDGFIEQGGIASSTSANTTVNLNTAFSNTNYVVLGIVDNGASSTSHASLTGVYSKSTTTFSVRMITGNSSASPASNRAWYACGY